MYTCSNMSSGASDPLHISVHVSETITGSDQDKLSRDSLCQERLQCSQGVVKATVYCQECDSYQCSNCDSFLHINGEMKQHHRMSAVGLYQGSKLCQMWCNPKNVASLYCNECDKKMCGVCDAMMHRGRRQCHSRKMFAMVKDNGKQNEVHTGVQSDVSAMQKRGFLLVSEKEELVVCDEKEFIELLGCTGDDKVKVVSMFGNTGDGKSHTLNHTFFNGQEVFSTSVHQSSCTVGVWAAYSSEYKAVFIDTEGLLGVSKNENRRTRLLLKVLAISDVVIYRTRAERLHNDLFTFLGDASDAYWKYFTPALKSSSEHYHQNLPLSTLGPCVVIFHETVHTELLGKGTPSECHTSRQQSDVMCETKQPVPVICDSTMCMSVDYGSDVHTPCSQLVSAEELLQLRFSELGRTPKAFSSIQYVGTQTKRPPTNFNDLRTSVDALLINNSVRASRKPGIVFKVLRIFNETFNGEIDTFQPTTFLDAYFSCPVRCLACGVRCSLAMNHSNDGVPHSIANDRCKFSGVYDNRIYLCKLCFDRGIETLVVPKTSASADSGWFGLAKYAWSGYVIECKECGVIYRSRQHWYGNKSPQLDAVKTANKHVWPEELSVAEGDSTCTGRRLLDNVNSVAGVISGVSAKPTKMVGSWIADKVAPSYWVPNSEITACGKCGETFAESDTKHHCRACGNGFCVQCSSKTMPVPWRGWGNSPVRVCDPCFENYYQKRNFDSVDFDHTKKKERAENGHTTQEKSDVTARYVGEVVQSAIGAMTGAISYPKDIIVESVRPAYWIPDNKIKCCHNCKTEFMPQDAKHHCRACGQGFCANCCSEQVPVPSRGWDYPVRVCVSCSVRSDL